MRSDRNIEIAFCPIRPRWLCLARPPWVRFSFLHRASKLNMAEDF